MASFLVDLVLTLAYSTSTNYLWYIRNWMGQPEQGGQMDPLEGVFNWDSWSTGVEVETFVPSEPRLEVPFDALVATANIADPQCLLDCVTVLLCLNLWYTCSRSEFPLPKSKHGDDGFDRRKHCRIRDVSFGMEGSSWMMGTIKQDRKGSRPGMSIAEGDSVPRKECLVGRVDGILDLHVWAQYYIQLRRECGTWKPDHLSDEGWLESPFFADENGDCLIYSTILTHWRAMMKKANVEGCDKYAFH